MLIRTRARWSATAALLLAGAACGGGAASGTSPERDANVDVDIDTDASDAQATGADSGRDSGMAGDATATTDASVHPDGSVGDADAAPPMDAPADTSAADTSAEDAPADTGPDTADAPSALVGRNLVFSYGQVSSTNGTAASELRLGYLAFAADGSLEALYFSYIPEVDAPQSPTTAFHAPMNAPYGNGQCSPGPIYLAPYQSFVDVSGTWSWSNATGLLTVTFGAQTQTWTLENATTEFYRLSSLTSSDAAVSYSVMLGMGYGTSYVDAPGDQAIATSELGDYSGEFYSNNGGSTTSPYNESMPELNTSVFSVAPSESDVLSYSDPCPTNSEWCEESLLVNYAPFSKLIVYQNGGHDFNEDGCFDEPGHAFTLYGIYNGTRIAHIVFIEYSYQSAGFPIVSVGRYY